MTMNCFSCTHAERNDANKYLGHSPKRLPSRLRRGSFSLALARSRRYSGEWPDRFGRNVFPF